MYSNTTKTNKKSAKCTPVTFDDLCQNVYIIMLIYAEEKGSYVLEIGWTVALFPWDIFLVHMDTYPTMNLKQGPTRKANSFLKQLGRSGS